MRLSPLNWRPDSECGYENFTALSGTRVVANCSRSAAERDMGRTDTRDERHSIFGASLLGNHRTGIARSAHSKKAGPAFIVAGTGAAALEEVCNVLTENKKPKPVGEQASLFFYVLPFTHYVELDEVRRTDSKIVVKYHFVSHATKSHSTHFALIPLGKVSPGVRVEFVQLPLERGRLASNKPIPKEVVERVVCQSFTLKE
jgi:hypothetical protein